jgi:hypothetical protein
MSNYNNIESKLENSKTTVKSNHYQYVFISIITFLLLTLFCLSYFSKTNFIYEYIILAFIIIYILYYFYNYLL